jgi:ketopantoate reductase
VQNGWGHGELLAEHVPAERLVVGVTFEGANAPTPDRVVHDANGPTQLGPWRPGSGADAAEAVAVIIGGIEASWTAA